MKFQHNLRASALTIAGFAAAALARSTAQPASATSSVMTDAEVRKVDLSQGTVMLKLGRIENLSMPGMTMVFKATDAKLLQGLSVGQKVKFHAEESGGVLSVTDITPAP